MTMGTHKRPNMEPDKIASSANVRHGGLPSDGKSQAEDSRLFLLRVSGILTQRGDLTENLAAFAEELARFCGASGGSVYVYNDDKALEDYISVGLTGRVSAEVEKFGHSQWADYFWSFGGPVLLDSNQEAGFPTPLHKLAKSEGIDALISVPLMYESKLCGLLLLFFPGRPELPEPCREALEAVARFAGLEVASSRLAEARKWEQKAQDQFLVMLSHELRTPLTSIMGFAQIVRRRAATSREIDSKLRDQLDLIWAQTQRLNRLLDTLADIADIERGDFTVLREPVDITRVLRAALEQSQLQTRTRHVIRADIPVGPIWIMGDAKRLEHVFNHIISNAIRYAPERSPVSIRCDEQSAGGEVLIEVTDDGPGISEHLQREIFHRFYPSDTRKSGGLGAGLYVSRAIVYAHGGRLSLKSAPGQGTVVSVRLPLGRW